MPRARAATITQLCLGVSNEKGLKHFLFPPQEKEEENAMYILANGRLITRDSALPYLEDGGVAIDGERIAAVGSTAQLYLLSKESTPT